MKKHIVDNNPKTPGIPDNIIQVNALEKYMDDMGRYSLYILFERYVPNINDGLKPVQRRILYCMWNDVKCTSIRTKRKSANTTGAVIAAYHPHSADAVYGACKCLANWFECKMPLVTYDSASGSIQGDPQAAARYTESFLSEFAMDAVLADLEQSRSVIDWSKTFDNTTIEPNCLPVRVPLLLVNGVFGIAIGQRIEAQPHSLNDVIDATLAVLHDPNASVVLIPDPCQKCEIVNTNWKKISNLGFGYFKERGIIDIGTTDKGHPYLAIKSVPDLVWPNAVLEKIEDLIKKNIIIQIADIQDFSTDNQLDIRIILKKGADPEFVKQMLYKHTQLQDTKRVNMQVVIQNGSEVSIQHIGYKTYIANFIEFRREVKFRLYNAKLQKIETRLHTIEIYIKILESGDIDGVIRAIRSRTQSNEDELIQWLMNKLKITDVQAKFVLNTQLKALSRGSLNVYKAEQKRLFDEVNNIIKIITTPALIDQEIENELLEIRAKYGRPRQSVLISESAADNIPSGTFQITVYDNATIKKTMVGEPVKSYKGASPICVCTADNAKNMLIFDNFGRAFSLPVHRLPLSDKSTAGMDMRIILKRLGVGIVSAIYLPSIEALADKKPKYHMIITTVNGYIKRIDLDDILQATQSGVIYSKLGKSDLVADIVIANQKSDVLIYTNSKALRVNIANIPYLKRSAIGNIGIKLSDKEGHDVVEGLTIINPNCIDLVVVTRQGKFNRIPQNLVPASVTNRVGNKIIKLSKDDSILGVYACEPGMLIRCLHPDGSATDIDPANIEYGSSVSAGIKLTKDISKANIIRL